MGAIRLCVGVAIALLLGIDPAMAQTAGSTLPTGSPPSGTAPATRPPPPTRDPRTPGYVLATELPDGGVPPLDVDGNFIIGPTHTPAAEMAVHEGVPRGTVYTFTMSSADRKFFPGIARDSGTRGTVSPDDPATLIVTTSHPAPYTRRVAVYVPAQYVPSTIAPFIVGADGPDQSLFAALDNLIAQKRVPTMIANPPGIRTRRQDGLAAPHDASARAAELFRVYLRRENLQLGRGPGAEGTNRRLGRCRQEIPDYVCCQELPREFSRKAEFGSRASPLQRSGVVLSETARTLRV